MKNIIDNTQDLIDLSTRNKAPCDCGCEVISNQQLHQFIPYMMVEVIGHWHTYLQHHLRGNNLTNIKARILAVLSCHPGVTINELAAYTVIEQSTISRALDNLENQGFINRVADTNDRRVRRIFISSAGKQQVADAWPTVQRSADVLLKNISNREHQSLLKTLKKMQENISPPK